MPYTKTELFPVQYANYIMIQDGPQYEDRNVLDCDLVGDEEAIGNAKLFAAAQYLLAACEEFVRKCECGEARSKRSYAQMKDAINKAKGL